MTQSLKRELEIQTILSLHHSQGGLIDLTLFQARSGITFPSQTGQILPTYTFGYINPLNDFILHKTCSLTNILSFRWLQLPKTALVTKILYVAQNGYGQNLPSLARKRLFQSTFEKPVQATKFLLLLIFQKKPKTTKALTCPS